MIIRCLAEKKEKNLKPSKQKQMMLFVKKLPEIQKRAYENKAEKSSAVYRDRETDRQTKSIIHS